MDLHSISKLDPDPNRPKKLDPDPNKSQCGSETLLKRKRIPITLLYWTAFIL
jgi:hypothetical protein